MPDEDAFSDPPHHVRKRRAKRILRFVPRRAVFHRYPLVGRFADAARKRAYLWSFKPEHVRPAVYFGSILALWPVMGVQLPLAFVLALLFRGNLMVAGALQLITNPLSAWPVYYTTYRVGRSTLEALGWSLPDHAGTRPEDVLSNGGSVLDDLAAFDAAPADPHWASAFGGTISALVVGGTLCGLLLAVVLDLLYRRGFAFRHRHDAAP